MHACNLLEMRLLSTQACIHTNTHIHAYIHTYIYTHACMHVTYWRWDCFPQKAIFSFSSAILHVCMYVCMHACMCRYTNVCVYTCACVHIKHEYEYTCAHIYITNTHTQTQTNKPTHVLLCSSYVCTYACIYARMHVCEGKLAHARIHVRVCA